MNIIKKDHGDRAICGHNKGEEAGWLSTMGKLEYAEVKSDVIELPIVPPKTWKRYGSDITTLAKYIESEINSHVETVYEYPGGYIAVKFVPKTIPKWIIEI